MSIDKEVLIGLCYALITLGGIFWGSVTPGKACTNSIISGLGMLCV